MNWRVKGVVQGVLSRIPGGSQINSLLQKSLGDLRDLDFCVDKKVGDWEVFLAHMRELGIAPQGLDYLEVGTGWFPTLPVCFSLAEAKSIQTFDVTRHLDRKLTFRMLQRLQIHSESLAVCAGNHPKGVQARLHQLLSCETIPQMLDCARIRYHAPCNAAQTGLPYSSVDMVFSNSVLEHVPLAAIRGIMKENVRVLRPGGIAIHSVNCGDHYAYFDRTISPIHYLAYPEKQWKPWNNSLLFQNRLRPQDFLSLAREAGMQPLLDRQTVRPELLQELPTARIAPEFQGYSAEQLAATSVDFIVRRPKVQVSVSVHSSSTGREAVSRSR